MNVFERTFRDYAALSYRNENKSEYEKAMEWAANEITALRSRAEAAKGRYAALAERATNVEGIAKILFMQNSKGDWNALTESAQNEYWDSATSVSNFIKGGK